MLNRFCRLIGGGTVIGQPSPYAAEIDCFCWRRLASLDFNYYAEGTASRDLLYPSRAHDWK